MTIHSLLQILDDLFPFENASSWDNVGLQVGDSNQKINSILTTLDVTLDVVNEAIDTNCNCIIAHHPLIFQPLKTILYDSPIGEIIKLLIQHNISLIVTHTNFDVAKTGMNHVLANKLQLKNQSALIDPKEDHAIGIMGTINSSTLESYVSTVQSIFDVKDIRYVGNDTDEIKTVAVIGGSGSSYLTLVASNQVDCFITGDVTYHRALDARALGINVIDVGHYVEEVFKTSLKEQLLANGLTCSIQVSQVDTNPYKSL